MFPHRHWIRRRWFYCYQKTAKTKSLVFRCPTSEEVFDRRTLGYLGLDAMTIRVGASDQLEQQRRYWLTAKRRRVTWNAHEACHPMLNMPTTTTMMNFSKKYDWYLHMKLNIFVFSKSVFRAANHLDFFVANQSKYRSRVTVNEINSSDYIWFDYFDQFKNYCKAVKKSQPDFIIKGS